MENLQKEIILQIDKSKIKAATNSIKFEESCKTDKSYKTNLLRENEGKNMTLHETNLFKMKNRISMKEKPAQQTSKTLQS
jgi:hypothetical protein